MEEVHSLPNKKSAMKNLRSDPKRRMRNKAVKSEVKTLLKNAQQAMESGDIDEARNACQAAISKLDKAVKKGIMKKGTANRIKSRLTIKLNKVVSQNEAA
jgi:small subunit ribosomal protein S20